MATEILATGSTAANSTDVVISSATTVALKGLVDSTAQVIIKLKDDAAAYNVVGELSAEESAKLLVAPGTYRFTRVAGGTCGVFSA